MPWKNVCYVGYWFDETTFQTMLNTMIENKITHINLEFLVLSVSTVFRMECKDSSSYWLINLPSSLPSGNTCININTSPFSQSDISTFKTQMVNNGIKLFISIGGSTSFENGFSELWTMVDSKYYAGSNPSQTDIEISATDFANDIYEIIINNLVDGIDFDVENINQDFTNCSIFLGKASQVLKNKGILVSHAPQTPYFANGQFQAIYMKVYEYCKDIDFFNVQFYNQGVDYEDFEAMFVNDPLFYSSVTQLIANGIPSDKIVAGLAVDGNEIFLPSDTEIWPGKVPANWTKASDNFILCDTSTSILQNWFINGNTPGGAMMWLYNNQDSNSKVYVENYFGNINKSLNNLPTPTPTPTDTTPTPTPTPTDTTPTATPTPTPTPTPTATPTPTDTTPTPTPTPTDTTPTATPTPTPTPTPTATPTPTDTTPTPTPTDTTPTPTATPTATPTPTDTTPTPTPTPTNTTPTATPTPTDTTPTPTPTPTATPSVTSNIDCITITEPANKTYFIGESMNITWDGNTPPYTVNLLKKEDVKEITTTNSTNCTWKINVPPDMYQLRIDSEGCTAYSNKFLITMAQDICFVKDTLVETDQGNICIQNLIPGKHTIFKERILCITNTIHFDSHLIHIKAYAFGSYPNRDTIVSQHHKINGIDSFREAREYVNGKTITLLPYNREPLYNVLLIKHGFMKVHGMMVETLDPYCKLALQYKKN